MGSGQCLEKSIAHCLLPIPHYTSVSLLTVFVTVTLSEVPLVVLLLLPLVSATSNKINTAAPATQTHGEAYQFSVVLTEVVVVEVELDALSCASTATWTSKIIIDVSIILIPDKCFIVLFFLDVYCPSWCIQQLRQGRRLCRIEIIASREGGNCLR
jgi:hypothetical protein